MYHNTMTQSQQQTTDPLAHVPQHYDTELSTTDPLAHVPQYHNTMTQTEQQTTEPLQQH